ncbi:hypothetical protein FOL47_010167 [Perkinsus chesapeaki]|uniref:Uncharacterized protein n=1 Tax=Perkinsus chesapeaki TaxID=330153 RepID=A0A7J6L4I8_PERCH|nr:hypothetical protein FOL47_010167 [Perkinsus chesapeaki]
MTELQDFKHIGVALRQVDVPVFNISENKWSCRSCLIPNDDLIDEVVTEEREIERTLTVQHIRDIRKRQSVGVICSRSADPALHSAVTSSLVLLDVAPENFDAGSVSLFYCGSDGSVVWSYCLGKESCKATEAVIGSHACISCETIVLLASSTSAENLETELEEYFLDFLPPTDEKQPRLVNCPSPTLIIVPPWNCPTIADLVPSGTSSVSALEAHMKPMESPLPGDEVEFIDAMEHPPLTPAQGLQIARLAAAPVSAHTNEEMWGCGLFVPLVYLTAMAICPAASSTEHDSPLLWFKVMLADVALAGGSRSNRSASYAACMLAARLIGRSLCEGSSASNPRLRNSVVSAIKEVAIPCQACGRPRLFHQNQSHGRYAFPDNNTIITELDDIIKRWVPRITSDVETERGGSSSLKRQLVEASHLYSSKQRISSHAGAPICILCAKVNCDRFNYSPSLNGCFPTSLWDYGRQLSHFWIARPLYVCLQCRPFIMDYCRGETNDFSALKSVESSGVIPPRVERRYPLKMGQMRSKQTINGSEEWLRYEPEAKIMIPVPDYIQSMGEVEDYVLKKGSMPQSSKRILAEGTEFASVTMSFQCVWAWFAYADKHGSTLEGIMPPTGVALGRMDLPVLYTASGGLNDRRCPVCREKVESLILGGAIKKLLGSGHASSNGTSRGLDDLQTWAGRSWLVLSVAVKRRTSRLQLAGRGRINLLLAKFHRSPKRSDRLRQIEAKASPCGLTSVCRYAKTSSELFATKA